MVRLIAPILPHTAEEVWKHAPGTQVESVQLTDMPDPVPVWRDDALEEKWTALIQVRDEVNKALEQARRDKVVGNSLGAHVELYPDENTPVAARAIRRP